MLRMVVLVMVFALISAAALASDSTPQILLSEECTACHNSERFDDLKLDRQGWTELVKRMQGNASGQIDDKAADAIIDILVNTHGAK